MFDRLCALHNLMWVGLSVYLEFIGAAIEITIEDDRK